MKNFCWCLGRMVAGLGWCGLGPGAAGGFFRFLVFTEVERETSCFRESASFLRLRRHGFRRAWENKCLLQ